MKAKETRKSKSKTLKQAYTKLTVESPLFVSLYTKIARHPQLKLCDITGLEAHYICPRTGNQYHSMEVYERIRSMTTDMAHKVGAIRTLGKDTGPFGKR